MTPAGGRVERFYRWHAPIYDVTRRLFLADRARAVRALEIRPGDRVVDLACGTGLNLPWLRRASAGERIGVDLTLPMLERARRRDPEAHLVHSDLRHWEWEGEPADCMICTYGLSMIPDWPAALAHSLGFLRPGGTLVILDFHHLQGVLRAANPAMRAWFSCFGVRPGLPFEEELTGRFRTCRSEVRHGGWNRIVVAQGAHP
ncbi:MAG: O-methyltransferase [Gemmatimonadota bacterium]|nr:MAG: O-methyltransferase [Gemmatimonadota bacterium]